MKILELTDVSEGVKALTEGLADVVYVEESGMTHMLCRDEATLAAIEPAYADFESAKCETDGFPTLIIFTQPDQLVLVEIEFGNDGRLDLETLATLMQASGGIAWEIITPDDLAPAVLPDWIMALKPADA